MLHFIIKSGLYKPVENTHTQIYHIPKTSTLDTFDALTQDLVDFKT